MNVLAIGAHFDDIELGCSGALLNHVNQGDRVTMVVVTNSGFSNSHGDIIRKKETALEEGKKAAEIIGAELICLNYDTFMVPFDEELTCKLNEIIEQRKIDFIYSHWIHDLHRDHQYAGKCTI